MKLFLCSLALLVVITGDAQSKKNYVLEINGDTVSVSLDEPAVLKTKNGQTLNIKLKQKERLTFEDSTLSFQYTPGFTVSVKHFEDIDQILCISGSGNSFLIQKYKDVNPETIGDYMLGEITQESIDAGYKETKKDVSKTLRSGKVIKGKQSTLVLDDEKNMYAVYPVKVKKGGFMIVMIIVDPADDKEMKCLDVFWKSLSIKN
ncbi:MAG TPA: hypothetical protein VGO58_00725 [Chitinophagaceae bacterium]|nr:hypothetical protein [Chitinophagaceae bacterium]